MPSIPFSSASLSIRALLASAIAATALLIAASAASALPAPVLLETTGGAGESSKTSPPSNLFQVNPDTGAATSLGNTGYAITALAQDPTTGILYGASNVNSPIAPRTLLILNPANGAAVPVGSLLPARVADMSFDSSGRLFGWSEEEDTLVSIDKATGAATVVGKNEFSTYGSGSAFDRNDNYWLFGDGEGEVGGGEGEYFTVDTGTGVLTSRGFLTPIDENESAVSAASYDCARATAYAVIQNYGKPPANLVTIDTVTGAVTNKGLTTTGADGLEWYCPLGFEFTSTSATVDKAGAQTLTLPVVRGPRIKGTASVSFATQSGTALAGRDFVATSGTLSFANNASALTIPLTVTPDPKAGSNRSFTLSLSNPSSGGSVANGTYTVTIKASTPSVAKVKGPKKTKAQRPVFKLRSDQLPASFRCKLDKRKFRNCGQNSEKGKKFRTPKLAPGKHKLVVQVVNFAGLSSTPVKKKFVILPKD
jgi:hypothetical protein